MGITGIFLILAALGVMYAVLLSNTAYGRALNKHQPALLTAIGLCPVILATFAVGQVDGLTLALMLAAVGTPFVVRAIWRTIADNINTERRERLRRAYDDADR